VVHVRANSPPVPTHLTPTVLPTLSSLLDASVVVRFTCETACWDAFDGRKPSGLSEALIRASCVPLHQHSTIGHACTHVAITICPLLSSHCCLTSRVRVAEHGVVIDGGNRLAFVRLAPELSCALLPDRRRLCLKCAAMHSSVLIICEFFSYYS